MIKLSALNVKSDEESGSEELVAREGLDEIASQQYAKALDLQRKGNLPDAIQLLKDLLDTQVLYDVKKPAANEKVPGPLFILKYLCYKNLASMLSSAGEVESAIEAYCTASELDDTDVTLWYRLGLLCLHAKRYEMALAAFRRGLDCNPRHWPCLDKVVTLLLGMEFRKECIAFIYEALQLDPGYLRGLAYRRHIYTVYKFERDYLEYINPMYKWNEDDDGPIDEERAEKLLKEADEIRDIFIEQQKAEQFKYILPHLKLRKPITRLSWKSVGDALVDMHHYMTEYCFSHACPLEIVFKIGKEDESMDVCAEEVKELDILDGKSEEVVIDTEKIMDVVSEHENNDMSDKDKPVTDTEKVESDYESTPEPKTQKKKSGRRRGSDLSYLQQWEWCTRRSGRKNTTTSTTYRKDESIYDTLRRMIPIALVPKMNEKKENDEIPLDVADLSSLFQEKQELIEHKKDLKYFDSEEEEKDVRSFIDKYTETKHDIIVILHDYLAILAERWKSKWPEGLAKIFIEANKCYNNHIDIPACTDDNKQELIHYTSVNLLAEELIVNEKLNLNPTDNQPHDLRVVEPIGIILSLKPHIFQSTDCLEFILRQLWVKLHIQKLNNCDTLELDCLYGLMYEFYALGDLRESYNLNISNFSFKPDINLKEISESITFIERNMKLKTVTDLYYKGNYEEVLTIVIDCFEHFKTLSKQQEDRLSLDFSVYLTIILDTYWALGKVEDCFHWCFICLHEALKHYFRYTSGSPEYEKWTRTVLKILCSIEHILTNEGLSCLDALSVNELSQGLEDLIRIIGHQVETNAADMPFDTVVPWIIMHYILQREEDQGRGRSSIDLASFDYVPCPLMVLFIGHEKLGKREWCSKSDGKLLYFILDTVVPRLRTPYLSKSLEMVCQYLEQCVHCLFDHRGRKAKYLADHKASPQALDWYRAQQLYDIFRPSELPGLEGKVSAITSDTESLFHQILALLPSECDPHKYVPEMEKYMRGIEDKIPVVPPLLPYKMKDIYFLLGDYNFKKDKMGIKYNTLDVIINNDRFESWAQISLAKAVKLDHLLNSCKNLKNDKEFLNPATTAIRCFKRALHLNPTLCDMWIEYGNFVYAVHSFCSRLLKQASESLSMEDFESLEKQKENMLDTTQKCFNRILADFSSDNSNEETWQIYYMLGKVAEKRNKPPSIYLDYYMQGIKSLLEIKATYPAKINYSSPTKLCIEVLELHYRIHASILKYIEQHENKPIPESVGKVFASCIEEWLQGPFARKKKQDCNIDIEKEIIFDEPVQAANILKRSVSDAGEEDTHEAKRLKLESAAAKVRRSASHDTERFVVKDSPALNETLPMESNTGTEESVEFKDNLNTLNLTENPSIQNIEEKYEKAEKIVPEENQNTISENKEDSSSSTSSSSSDSSSSDSTTDSSSGSEKESDTSSKSSNGSKPLTEDEIMKIVSACLDALEDCASRFPQHYKAIYRLAHYHFYYKKGRDIERCRDLMLSTFTSRFGQKLGGLFSERKHNNFFNNVWKIPSNEVDRGGSFPFHMNRSVLLTLEILKEIDDHKTLLDLSLHLQKIPDRDKKYLRDSDREELAQQAFSLCVQSLKGQVIRFSQQADLKSNEIERQALKSLMLEIYNAYQRAQKQPNSKQFTNLLIDGYKLLSSGPFENKNLVDLSMKYCQALKQQAASNSTLDKNKNLQKKQAAKAVESVKVANISYNLPKPDAKPPASSTSSTVSALPKISAQDMTATFKNYVPMTNDQLLAQQTAAALSYLSNISTMALQSSLQYSLQNSFQAEFYRQCVGQFSPFSLPPPKKQKRGPKASSTIRTTANVTQVKATKPTVSQSTSVVKSIPTPVITSQKTTTASLAPSMGTVLPTLPASMAANLSAFGASSHTHSGNHSSVPAQAHMSSNSSVNAAIHSKPPMPHQQVSPGKTLQEKLAERQKNLPTVSKATSHDVSREINQSINRLPSSLTITKTSAPKQPLVVGKRPEVKKSLPFSESAETRAKPMSSAEIIVLDDD